MHFNEIIKKYSELLLLWNNKINLISLESYDELLKRHIVDSQQLIKYIDKNQVIVDIGSGAGFPGMILSYAGIENVNLVETNKKKANFLTIAAKLSPNKVNIYNARIEDLKLDIADVITARGFTSLEQIFFLTSHIARNDTKYFLHKGRNVEEEIKNSFNKWKFEYILHQSDTSDEGRILEVMQLRKR